MESQLNTLINQELEILEDDPPLNIMNIKYFSDIRTLRFIVIGPNNTPHEGGWFYMRLVFPVTYPTDPPKCFSDTLIYHTNIEFKVGGWYCLNNLKPQFWNEPFGRISLNQMFLKIYGGLDSPQKWGVNMNAIDLYQSKGKEAYDLEVKRHKEAYAGKNLFSY